MMGVAVKRLQSDETGGVLVEATVMLAILFVFVLGSVDFLMAMYQWNAATKAVQQGARIASVSAPVSSDLSTMTGLGAGVDPGEPMPYFKRTCASNSCSGGGTYNATAMATIVSGRGCGFNPIYCAGMTTFFPRIQTQNVVVTYEQTGLGYAGRPGGPVPTITVTLQNLPFQFFFLNGLRGFGNIQIAPIATGTAEDLSSSAPTT
jgi:hypothetical protein